MRVRDGDGFKSIQKGKNNEYIDNMESAQRDGASDAESLDSFPWRISEQNRQSGETPSLTVADWSPEVDPSQDDQGYLLKADLPEMKKDDVRVTVEDDVLCVSGERKAVKEDQKRKFHRIERSFGNFRRSFTLPEDADSTKVTAEFRDGVPESSPPDNDESKIKSSRS